MKLPNLKVAILLATYNGERFIEQQVKSLRANSTSFTLYWLDDHSTDATREAVHAASIGMGIMLKECHQSQRQGVPGSFFTLLECVEADIYLFCDQDDVWQPGKIDATVQTLLPDLAKPAMCFSDPLAFRDSEPDVHYHMLDLIGTTAEIALQESKVFLAVVGYGHTVGFTRPMREIFVTHKDIARTHAFMHDLWMYNIAVASGTVRMLADAPTTLFRRHALSASGGIAGWRGSGMGRITITWDQHMRLRRCISRHAAGFILASPTLPQGPKLERLLAIAELVSTLDRRQSPLALIRLVRRGIVWPNWRLATGLAVTCLCSAA